MLTINDTPTAAPRGDVYVEVYRRGRLVDVIDERNLIVDTGRQNVCRILGGESNRAITKIGYGEGASPAAAGNNSLLNAFVKSLGSVTYPTTTSVQFPFTLLTSEANGLAIMEFGLLTTGGVLYARKVRQNGPIYKDDETSLAGTWTITY